MTAARLRFGLCLTYIAFHILMGLSLAFLFVKKWLLYTDFIGAFAVIVPSLTITSSVIIKYVVKHRESEPDDEKVSPMFRAISVMVTVLYILSIIWIVRNQVKYPFEGFIEILLIIEGLFGLYIGSIIESLFKSS